MLNNNKEELGSKKITGFLPLYKNYIVFSATLVLSLTMLLSTEGDKAHFAREVIVAIFQGEQRIFFWATRMSELWSENRALRKANAQLSVEVQRLREEKLENVRLRKLLGFEREIEFEFVPAEVVALDADRMVNSILIDAGMKDGVAINMPVITADGVVGKTVQVFPKTSIIQLLLDRNCRVSALVQRESRVFGIVEWNGGDVLRFNFPIRSDVKKGDLIVSSGMGGIFPSGLKIGIVAGFGRNTMGLFREAILIPSAHFSRLEEVFVLTKKKNEGVIPLKSESPDSSVTR